MDGPEAPDPAATAAAQTRSNQETANYQNSLNSQNQVTPTGSLTYSEDGKWSNGAPRMTATTSLTPEQQAIFNTNQQTQGNIASIGRDQSSRIGTLLGTPLNLNNEATEARLMELGSKRLDPMFAQRSQQLEQDLMNRGIRPGSAAYDTMRGQYDESRNDAYNQLLLNGRGQAVQEMLTERNQPINEITALMSGSQVSQPNFQQTPQTGVANTDIAGITQNAYNAESANHNAMMGGLFGLAGSGVRAAGTAYGASDRRLKRNIERIGTYANGLAQYAWNYVWGGARHIGVMADEVLALRPEAVSSIGGFMVVDYALALAE